MQHAEPSTRGRLRSFEASPALFRLLALASVVLIYLAVTSGAVVRLTGSGLGCDNWPACGESAYPTGQLDGHAWIEFVNRVINVFAVLATLAAWLVARRTPGLARWVKRVALAAFVGAVAQIPLGGITVLSGLHPLVVMQHFLLALVVLALSVVLLWEARGHETGIAAPLVPEWLQRAAYVLVAACGALVLTGAFATASGPHPGDSSDVSRVWTVEGTVYVHVRATAVFGILFLVALAYLVWRRSSPRLLALALGLLALLVGQMIVGEIQYRDGLPWWQVLIHVSFAAAIWAWTVVLAVAFRRPLASLARPSP